MRIVYDHLPDIAAPVYDIGDCPPGIFAVYDPGGRAWRTGYNIERERLTVPMASHAGPGYVLAYIERLTQAAGRLPAEHLVFVCRQKAAEALFEVGAFFVSDPTWEFEGTGPPWWTQGFQVPIPTAWDRLAREDIS